MKKNEYTPGQWNFICDSCGQKLKSYFAKTRWDGLKVCPSCYEDRHPQDFVRAKKDTISIPWSRPESADDFVTGVCNMVTRSGFADYGTADCSQVGQTWGYANAQELLDEQACSETTMTGIAGIGVAGCVRPGYNIALYL